MALSKTKKELNEFKKCTILAIVLQRSYIMKLYQTLAYVIKD